MILAIFTLGVDIKFTLLFKKGIGDPICYKCCIIKITQYAAIVSRLHGQKMIR